MNFLNGGLHYREGADQRKDERRRFFLIQKSGRRLWLKPALTWFETCGTEEDCYRKRQTQEFSRHSHFISKHSENFEALKG
jgi:hypothetical protein